MKTFFEYFDDVSIMDYEMFNLTSNFGENMIKNFNDRGIPLLSKYDYMNKQSILDIYEKIGY